MWKDDDEDEDNAAVLAEGVTAVDEEDDDEENAAVLPEGETTVDEDEDNAAGTGSVSERGTEQVEQTLHSTRISTRSVR